MDQKITKVKTKKHSQITKTIVNCISDIMIIGANIGLIIIHQKKQEPYDMNTFDPIANKLQIILLLIMVLAMAFILIYSAIIDSHTEKDDELSLLHKYKAGYIGKTVSAFIFAIVVFIVKDFSFAFTGDFFDRLCLPIIIIIASELISNITFIILEKFQLD